MNTIWIAAVLAAAAVAALWWWKYRRVPAERRTNQSTDKLDTLSAWEPTPTRVLTGQERLAYALLVKALPGHMILAQVPLSRFLKVPTRNSYNEWLSRVGQLCADLVVCDHSSQVVAVVDIRVPPHQASDRNRRRHNRMKRVLKAAGIPLHVWIENDLPTVDAAREAILPAPLEADAAAPAAPTRVAPPAVATPARAPAAPPRRPATAAGSAHEEPARRTVPTLNEEAPDLETTDWAELREPPPSTWFDNLESAAVPLDPPRPKR